MEKYVFYFDRKVIVWERETLTLEASTLEEAKSKCRCYADMTVCDKGNIELDDRNKQYIESTKVFMEPSVNNAPTLEITCDSDNTTIWDNKHKIEEPTMSYKQLSLF